MEDCAHKLCPIQWVCNAHIRLVQQRLGATVTAVGWFCWGFVFVNESASLSDLRIGCGRLLKCWIFRLDNTMFTCLPGKSWGHIDFRLLHCGVMHPNNAPATKKEIKHSNYCVRDFIFPWVNVSKYCQSSKKPACEIKTCSTITFGDNAISRWYDFMSYLYIMMDSARGTEVGQLQ